MLVPWSAGLGGPKFGKSSLWAREFQRPEESHQRVGKEVEPLPHAAEGSERWG
jgi:hypothetical protein